MSPGGGFIGRFAVQCACCTGLHTHRRRGRPASQGVQPLCRQRVRVAQRRRLPLQRSDGQVFPPGPNVPRPGDPRHVRGHLPHQEGRRCRLRMQRGDDPALPPQRQVPQRPHRVQRGPRSSRRRPRCRRPPRPFPVTDLMDPDRLAHENLCPAERNRAPTGHHRPACDAAQARRNGPQPWSPFGDRRTVGSPGASRPRSAAMDGPGRPWNWILERSIGTAVDAIRGAGGRLG